jgi:hypothetical protein
LTLLLVNLDLRKIRVVGEVGGEVRGHAVLDVAAEVAGQVVVQRRNDRPVGGQARGRVRLQLEILSGRRQVEPNQRAAG